MHAVGRSSELGTALHLAVANQSEPIVQLLLSAGASPFLVHGDSSALDTATAANHAPLVRRMEGLGLFGGWLLQHREPGLFGELFGIGSPTSMRWISVVPRYRSTPQGLLCKHQLRVFKSLSDGAPATCWDVESASLSADGAVARVVAHAAPGAAQRVLAFSDATIATNDACAKLVQACMNRAPPRVPRVGEARRRRTETPPQPVDAPEADARRRQSTPPTLPCAASFPSPPPAAPTRAAPAPPPRAAPAPPPPSPAAVASPEAQEDADLAEAIRRSLGVSGAARPAPAAAPSPSAPPLPPTWAAPLAARLAVDEDEDDSSLCVVCLSGRRTAGLLHGTSMHVVACATCAPRLQGLPCPLCRAMVERIVSSIYS